METDVGAVYHQLTDTYYSSPSEAESDHDIDRPGPSGSSSNKKPVFDWKVACEKLLREMADRMSSDGYLNAGYEYLIIDDCWLERERGSDGKLKEDRQRFPSGMKNLSDYVKTKFFSPFSTLSFLLLLLLLCPISFPFFNV